MVKTRTKQQLRPALIAVAAALILCASCYAVFVIYHSFYRIVLIGPFTVGEWAVGRHRMQRGDMLSYSGRRHSYDRRSFVRTHGPGKPQGTSRLVYLDASGLSLLRPERISWWHAFLDPATDSVVELHRTDLCPPPVDSSGQALETTLTDEQVRALAELIVRRLPDGESSAPYHTWVQPTYGVRRLNDPRLVADLFALLGRRYRVFADSVSIPLELQSYDDDGQVAGYDRGFRFGFQVPVVGDARVEVEIRHWVTALEATLWRGGAEWSDGRWRIVGEAGHHGL